MAQKKTNRKKSEATTRGGSGSARSRATRGGAKKGALAFALRWGWRLLKLGLALGLLGAGAVAGALWYYSRDLPDVRSLRDYRPPQITRVLDRNGEVIGEVFAERRTVVPVERIPRSLVLSVLAAEDADFYRHEGLDYAGILRALVRGVLSGGHFRGTSTITQQLVKNLLLSPERSLARKLRELLLARQIEQVFTKEEILGLYLNHINFGHGRYGVQEAARYYFGKNVEELTLAESSLIAGLPQSPTHLSPRDHPEAARRRQRFVLDQLQAKRAERWPELSVEEIEEARGTPMHLVPLPEHERTAPEVVAYARQILRERVGEEAAERGGYTIHTTIDVERQRQAREALQTRLGEIDERQRLRGPLRAPRQARALPAIEALAAGRTYDARVTGTDDTHGLIELDIGGHPAVAHLSDLVRYNPEERPASELAPVGAQARASVQRVPREGEEDARAEARLELGPQGAVVLIEPRSRDLLAIVGGYEAEAGFNRARMAVRQPGSTFKPLVYGLGLIRRRFTPASIVIDAPGVYDEWRPQNYETWSFQGELRLREALARSINQVAVRVMEEVTPAEVVRFARQLGITAELDPTLALALGASDVTPLEMANAYATFAAGGRFEEVRLIRRIEGPGGVEVPLPARAAPRDVMSPAEAYLITSMLTSVVDHGTARAARRLGRPAAGKTGTSNDVRDAWFVGYTADLVAAVWVGFDDRRPLGRRESGAHTALPIWMDVMRAASEGRPPRDFAMPSGVVRIAIDPTSGLLPYPGQEGTMEEVFLEGTEPTEEARPPDLLAPTDLLMQEVGMQEIERPEIEAQGGDDGAPGAPPEAAP